MAKNSINMDLSMANFEMQPGWIEKEKDKKF